MTKRRNQNGFVLIIIVVFIALFGLMMIVLSSISRTMMHESFAAKLEAANKNLTSSAKAWAKYNTPNMSVGNEPLKVQLDVNDLGIPDAVCTVTFHKLSNMKIEINAICDTDNTVGN